MKQKQDRNRKEERRKKKQMESLREGWDKQARWKPSELTCNEKDSEQILGRSQ